MRTECVHACRIVASLVIIHNLLKEQNDKLQSPVTLEENEIRSCKRIKALNFETQQNENQTGAKGNNIDKETSVFLTYITHYRNLRWSHSGNVAV